MPCIDELAYLLRQLRVRATQTAANVKRACPSQYWTYQRNPRKIIGRSNLRQLETESRMREAKQRRHQEIHVAAMTRRQNDKITLTCLADCRLDLRFAECDFGGAGAKNFSEEIRKRASSWRSMRLLDRPANVRTMHPQRCFARISLQQML